LFTTWRAVPPHENTGQNPQRGFCPHSRPRSRSLGNAFWEALGVKARLGLCCIAEPQAERQRRRAAGASRPRFEERIAQAPHHARSGCEMVFLAEELPFNSSTNSKV